MTKSIKRKYLKKNKTKKNRTKNILDKKEDIFSEKVTTIQDIIQLSQDNKINDEMNAKFTYLEHEKNKNQYDFLIKNDFYSYINKLWLSRKLVEKEMKYLIKLDDFRIAQFKVYNELDDIIKNYIAKHNNKISLELKNYYLSANRFNSIMSSKLYLKKIVQYIDKLREDKNNLWKILAFVNSNELMDPVGPFSWKKDRDKKDSSQYIDYINPHNFAIFDPSIYDTKMYNKKETSSYAKNYKNLFNKYLNKLFKTAFPKDKSLNVEDVFEIGQKFFYLFGKNDPNIKESPIFYNKVTADEAHNKYHFNWKEYSKELGYAPNKIPDFFVVSNLNYFKFCTELLIEEWNSEKWRSYWIWIIARFVARLTNKWEEWFFSYHGKVEQGLAESIRQTKTHAMVNSCVVAFSPLLNNEYIDLKYNEKAIIYATDMANNFKQIFINKIRRNTWMNPKTRIYSEFKLKNITLQIGSNKFDDNYDGILPLLNFNPDEYLDNFLKVMHWRHDIFIEGNANKINTLAMVDFTQYPAKITNLPSFIVNAQYTAWNNSITVPTAYLQKPFIDLDEEGTEYNLAYIGFTIAHELSHSLDDMGSQYDYDGNMINWWTNSDKKAYEKLQNEIIKHYEISLKHDKVVDVDVSLSIGEDIADISGLNLCEEYLRNFCIKNKWSALISFYHFRIFYVYFAYQMRQRIEKKSLKYELITNPHPTDKYRTNVPLSRSPFFRNIFKIQKGDKMYWDNKNGIWD